MSITRSTGTWPPKRIASFETRDFLSGKRNDLFSLRKAHGVIKKREGGVFWTAEIEDIQNGNKKKRSDKQQLCFILNIITTRFLWNSDGELPGETNERTFISRGARSRFDRWKQSNGSKAWTRSNRSKATEEAKHIEPLGGICIAILVGERNETLNVNKLENEDAANTSS